MSIRNLFNAKAVYDERQVITQLRLGIDSFIIFACAAVANSFVMDYAYSYAESQTIMLLLFAMLCMMIYNLRCAAKGCLIGINGVKPMRWTAIWCIVIETIGLVDKLKFALNDKKDFILSDGRLGDKLIAAILMVLFIIYGVTTLIVLNKIEKKEPEESEEK